MRSHLAFTIFIFALLLILSTASATEFTPYQLNYSEEGQDEPITTTETFTASNPNLTYAINIRLSSATTITVYLNGVLVVDPSEIVYVQNVATLHKPVSVLTSNSITVESPGQSTGNIDVSIVGSTVHTSTLTAVADSYIRSKSANKNTNYGSQPYLRIEAQNASRALIAFNTSEIASVLSSGRRFVSASLDLYVESNFGGWGTSGRTVKAQQLVSPYPDPYPWECEWYPPDPPICPWLPDWTEMSTTWNCSNDENISNNQADCDDQWNGTSTWPQPPEPSPTVLHKDNETGWVQFNVDLLGVENPWTYGWVIKKTDEGLGGSLDYTSNQGMVSQRPKLVINWEENDQDHTPPTISASVSPASNAAGWNNSDVVVSFTCSDETGLAFCPPPISVTTEGANQIFMATAVDNSGNSSTASVTLNLDKTEPSLEILSPANGVVVHDTSVHIEGTVSDSLSGFFSITCAGVTATYASGSFECDPSLIEGLNTIVVAAVDFAGKENFLPLKITYTAEAENTYTFYPIGDVAISSAYDYGSGSNHGLDPTLGIESAGTEGAVLLQFQPDEMISRIGTQHVISATLEMYVENNLNDWGMGAYIDVHRIRASWNESGVTYDCYPSDEDLFDPNPNCEEFWGGGYHEEAISHSMLQENSTFGWQYLDVTGDVQAIQNGIENYGWMIRKRNYADNGTLDFTSIQGTTEQRPRLIVFVDDQQCLPTSIESVSPGLIPSDGTSFSVTVMGQNLDRISTVYLDGIPVSITVQNPPTMATILIPGSSSPLSHTLSFKSDCLTAPLPVFTVEANTMEYQLNLPYTLEAPGSCAAHTATHFSLSDGTDRILCARSHVTRLIGYSGDFAYVNRNNNWPSESKDPVESYMTKAQYNSLSGVNSSRGSNLIRIITTGAACQRSGGPPNPCGGYLGAPERMPFTVKNNQWNIQMLDASNIVKVDGSQLDSKWRSRLRNFIKYADANGLAVMIDLFDQNSTGSGKSPGALNSYWTNNPWNPNNNNIDSPPASCSKLNDPRQGLPGLYKVCNNMSSSNCTLNCLGTIERNYVISVVNFVRNTKVCGNNGASQCKNVIFQVMNEASYNSTWNSAPENFSNTQFKLWHQIVSQWVKSHGDFLVAASVKGPATQQACSTTQGDTDDSCLLAACTSSACSDVTFNGTLYRNHFTPFLAPNINIVALHEGTWLEGSAAGNICDKDEEALVFRKPVIFDDDGDNSSPRLSNLAASQLQKWAQQVSESGTNSCGQLRGKLHLYHTKDGTSLEGAAPAQCRYDDVAFVDCFAWNALGDGVPEKFCGTVSGLTSCVSRTSYCENYHGNPDQCTPVQDPLSHP